MIVKGKEFSGHEEIVEILGIDTYFAKSHRSWERRINKNIDGLILPILWKNQASGNLDPKPSNVSKICLKTAGKGVRTFKALRIYSRNPYVVLRI